MFGCEKKCVGESHYDILSVKEDATIEEIRGSYRSALLAFHPDKLRGRCELSKEDRFLKVQRAWEVLGDPRSRVAYDCQLRSSRDDLGVADEIGLEDMVIEDGGDLVEMLYQCRCGDYFGIDALELGNIGCEVLRVGTDICFRTRDALPASVVLPCATCSLLVRLVINANVKVPQ